MFNGFREQRIIFDNEGNIIDVIPFYSSIQKPCTTIDGIPYPLFFMPIPNETVLSNVSDHPSLVGIVRFPNCTYTTEEMRIPLIVKIDLGDSVTYENISLLVEMATSITSSPVNSDSVTIPKII